MSAEACSVQMYTKRREALKGSVSLGVDFVPVVGDIKSIAEAQSAIDYLAATIGLVPLVGDVAGDLEQASKLINDASHEITLNGLMKMPE